MEKSTRHLRAQILPSLEVLTKDGFKPIEKYEDEDVLQVNDDLTASFGQARMVSKDRIREYLYRVAGTEYGYPVRASNDVLFHPKLHTPKTCREKAEKLRIAGRPFHVLVAPKDVVSYGFDAEDEEILLAAMMRRYLYSPDINNEIMGKLEILLKFLKIPYDKTFGAIGYNLRVLLNKLPDTIPYYPTWDMVRTMDKSQMLLYLSILMDELNGDNILHFKGILERDVLQVMCFLCGYTAVEKRVQGGLRLVVSKNEANNGYVLCRVVDGISPLGKYDGFAYNIVTEKGSIVCRYKGKICIINAKEVSYYLDM